MCRETVPRSKPLAGSMFIRQGEMANDVQACPDCQIAPARCEVGRIAKRVACQGRTTDHALERRVPDGGGTGSHGSVFVHRLWGEVAFLSARRDATRDEDRAEATLSLVDIASRHSMFGSRCSGRFRQRCGVRTVRLEFTAGPLVQSTRRAGHEFVEARLVKVLRVCVHVGVTGEFTLRNGLPLCATGR